MSKWWDVRKKRDAERKLRVFQMYGGVCACCGVTGDEFLTMDHINNDGWSDRQHGGSSGQQLYKELLRKGAPDPRFQILCWNCNLAKAHAPDHTCPHRR